MLPETFSQTAAIMSTFFISIQILAVLLIAVALSLSLAHALELPGKKRLTRGAYLAIQPIYYPGFTIGGAIGEAGGIIVTLILLFLTPFGSTSFWLTGLALTGLLGMQAVYWLRTHPINRYWLQSQELGELGSSFFSAGIHQPPSGDASRPASWTDLRDRWEYSHVARAGFAFVSLLAIVVATASKK